MSDRLEDTSLRLKDEMDLYKRMMDKLRHNRLEFQKEREATQEVGRKKEMRKGLEVGGNAKNYPRAGEEQKKVEEMLRLRLLSPLPLAEPQKEARWLQS